MQSIINTSGFGFCKASSLRNCNNCLYKLRCINYAPIYTNNVTEPRTQPVVNLQNRQIFEPNAVDDNQSIVQENLILKQKIQDLEGQILLLNQSKESNKTNSEQTIQIESNSSELQVYENKNLEVYQQTEVPLKAKKGIFGTKYVEDKPQKK